MQTPMILSTSELIKYIVFSLILAVITLLMVILPAEYNIDPTGIGHKLGLTVFHEPIAKELIQKDDTTEHMTAVIEVIVPAGRGVEYKFVMTKHQKLTYEWSTNGGALYFDLHGEPEGDTTGYFESYAIATLVNMQGSFTVPFSGSHGWYWKNTSDEPVTVQLTVQGEYVKHGLKS